jgi:L-asparagine transporter-like permease
MNLLKYVAGNAAFDLMLVWCVLLLAYAENDNLVKENTPPGFAMFLGAFTMWLLLMIKNTCWGCTLDD